MNVALAQSAPGLLSGHQHGKGEDRDTVYRSKSMALVLPPRPSSPPPQHPREQRGIFGGSHALQAAVDSLLKASKCLGQEPREGAARDSRMGSALLDSDTGLLAGGSGITQAEELLAWMKVLASTGTGVSTGAGAGTGLHRRGSALGL